MPHPWMCSGFNINECLKTPTKLLETKVLLAVLLSEQQNHPRIHSSLLKAEEMPVIHLGSRLPKYGKLIFIDFSGFFSLSG